MTSYSAKTAFLDLQDRIARIGQSDLVRQGKGRELVRFGDSRLDEALPWGGLPKGALHEVAAAAEGGTAPFAAAAGFAAALLSRAGGAAGMMVWCQNRRWARRVGRLYGPGLAPFGLDPNRLLLVMTGTDEEALWIMEECLRSAAIQAVLAEVGELDLTASRRLQLAAEKSGSLALLLRLPGKPPGNNAALTRWRVSPVEPAGIRREEGEEETRTFRWQASLWRCRGGGPNHWEVSWKDEAFHCHMAAQMADRLPAGTGDDI